MAKKKNKLNKSNSSGWLDNFSEELTIDKYAPGGPIELPNDSGLSPSQIAQLNILKKQQEYLSSDKAKKSLKEYKQSELSKKAQEKQSTVSTKKEKSLKDKVKEAAYNPLATLTGTETGNKYDEFLFGTPAMMANSAINTVGNVFSPSAYSAVGKGLVNIAPALANMALDTEYQPVFNDGSSERALEIGTDALMALPVFSQAPKVGRFITTNTPLKNTYKYNPWAFKPNESNWYRQVGKSAIDDAINTILIREAGEEISPRMWEEFQNQIKTLQGDEALSHFERMKLQMTASRRPTSPFFNKGQLFYPMGRKPIVNKKTGKLSKNPAGAGDADYLIETSLPNESFQPAYVKAMFLGIPESIGSTAILKPNPILRNLENFNFYKKDWLQGYKPITIKQNGGEINQYVEGGPIKDYSIYNQIVSDNTRNRYKQNTNQFTPEQLRLIKLENNRRSTDKKKRLDDRKERIKKSIEAQKQPLSLQNLADISQASGDKFRFFPNEESFIDDINPAVILGDWASGLGRMPLNIQQGNYGDAALSVLTPVTAGAFAGVGTKNTGQFLNNAFNPLAGVSDLFESINDNIYSSLQKNYPNISNSIRNIDYELATLPKKLNPFYQKKLNQKLTNANKWQDDWYNDIETNKRINQLSEYANNDKIYQDGLPNKWDKIKERINNKNYLTEFQTRDSKLQKILTGEKRLHEGNHGISGYNLDNTFRGNRQNFVNKYSSKLESTAIHEGNHGLTDGNALIPYNEQLKIVDIFGDNATIPYRNSIGEFDSYDEYLQDPTEVYARIMELRKYMGLKPGEVLENDKFLKTIAQGIKGNTPVDSRFFELIKDTPKFKDLFNRLPVAAPAAIGLGAASQFNNEQDGGEINQYADGGNAKNKNSTLSKLKKALSLRENLGNLNTEQGYNTPLSQILRTAVGMEGKDLSNESMDPIAREQDAFRMYLGLPSRTGAFEQTGPNKYRIRDYNKLYPDTLLSDEAVRDWGTPHEDGVPDPVNKAFDLYPYDDFVMGKHYITKGKDAKGEYLRYYDKFDLDPTRRANQYIDRNINPRVGKYLKRVTPVLDELESLMFNPFELEDKVYYDPKTKLRSDIILQRNKQRVVPGQPVAIPAEFQSGGDVNNIPSWAYDIPVDDTSIMSNSVGSVEIPNWWFSTQKMDNVRKQKHFNAIVNDMIDSGISLNDVEAEMNNFIGYGEGERNYGDYHPTIGFDKGDVNTLLKNYNPNNFKNGGKLGGLDRWFAEKWVDVKTGKECGRQKGEKRKGYPACRPSKRISSETPKTASELSAAEKAKFKREKTSSKRIDYNHKKEDGGKINDDNGYLISNLDNFTPKKIINSNYITTNNMAFPVDANGVILYPNTGDYIFPTNKVIETPIMQEGGKINNDMKKKFKKYQGGGYLNYQDAYKGFGVGPNLTQDNSYYRTAVPGTIENINAQINQPSVFSGINDVLGSVNQGVNQITGLMSQFPQPTKQNPINLDNREDLFMQNYQSAPVKKLDLNGELDMTGIEEFDMSNLWSGTFNPSKSINPFPSNLLGSVSQQKNGGYLKKYQSGGMMDMPVGYPEYLHKSNVFAEHVIPVPKVHFSDDTSVFDMGVNLNDLVQMNGGGIGKYQYGGFMNQPRTFNSNSQRMNAAQLAAATENDFMRTKLRNDRQQYEDNKVDWGALNFLKEPTGAYLGMMSNVPIVGNTINTALGDSFLTRTKGYKVGQGAGKTTFGAGKIAGGVALTIAGQPQQGISMIGQGVGDVGSGVGSTVGNLNARSAMEDYNKEGYVSGKRMEKSSQDFGNMMYTATDLFGNIYGGVNKMKGLPSMGGQQGTGGFNFSQLAGMMNQDGGYLYPYQEGGMVFLPEDLEIPKFKKGGLTAKKAREILHDKSVHGKPLTDKQRKYFGYISSQKKSNGGWIDTL